MWFIIWPSLSGWKGLGDANAPFTALSSAALVNSSIWTLAVDALPTSGASSTTHYEIYESTNDPIQAFVETVSRGAYTEA